MFPIIPVLSWLAALCGLGTWAWYLSLDHSEKQRANGVANEIAADLVGKAMDKMSEAQNQQVTQIEARFKG